MKIGIFQRVGIQPRLMLPVHGHHFIRGRVLCHTNSVPITRSNLLMAISPFLVGLSLIFVYLFFVKQILVNSMFCHLNSHFRSVKYYDYRIIKLW